MKKFSFNLEVLRRHRHIIEEQERTKFAAINFQLQETDQHLRSLRNRQWEMVRELTLKKAGRLDSGEIAWFYRYLDHLSKEMDKAAEKISQLQGQLDQQRSVLVGATKDSKILDNLRDRKEREFEVAHKRLEQKSIDEIVVNRFAHKSEHL